METDIAEAKESVLCPASTFQEGEIQPFDCCALTRISGDEISPPFHEKEEEKYEEKKTLLTPSSLFPAG